MRQEGFGEASPEKKTVRAWSNQHEGNKSKFEDSQEAVTVDTRLRGYDVGCGYGVGVACRQARTMIYRRLKSLSVVAMDTRLRGYDGGVRI